ncbi:MAG TPA: response regulator [Burkholderiales bacterium]|jgi:two-component system OmpR family response regulator|nr:response regulator [Burkholderiales bacterium]
MPERPLNRVCYVEDDEDIQRIVRMSLERVGKMTVEIVTDPLRAIDVIKAFAPDLVMLDWMMPGMDGPTLFRKMKQLPETASLPVVFITAKATQRDMDELVALGAAATISKPFNPKDLPEQLRAIWAKLP